jgi:hypothetical protein
VWGQIGWVERLGGASASEYKFKNAQYLLSKIDTKRDALARNFDVQIAWFSLDM